MRPVDEERADAHRPEVVDGELQEILDHGRVAVLGARGDGVDPCARRRFVVPTEALPAQHAEGADDPDRPRRVALHDRGVEHLREHDEVAFGAGGSVEDHPLVGAVGAADHPARQAVREQPRGREREAVDESARDGEVCSRLPGGRVGPRLDECAAARHPSLVRRGAERMVDLLEQERPDRVVLVEGESLFLELLGKTASPPRS